MKSGPAPVVIENEPGNQCRLCLFKPSGEWLRESLKLTRSKGKPRPNVRRILKIIRDAFPETGIGRDGLTTHLLRHEPEWGRWDGDDKA